MKALRPLLLSAAVVAPAFAGSGNTIGYAAASGYFKADSRPTLYQPLNLLDGRDATAWCSPTSDPLNDQLSFGFNEVIHLEELRVSTGNNFDEHTWGSFARARKIAVKTGKQSQTFTLEDIRGQQTLTFKTPLTGARFTVEVLDTYPADDPDQPACITDLVFVAEGKVLNGPWLTTKLKFDKFETLVLGTWKAGFAGTPDRFLSFNFDGTFHYTYEPYDTTRGTPKTIDGTYDISGQRLVLTVEGKKHQLKYSRDAKDAHATLSLEGDVPEDFKQAWRSNP